MFAWGGGASVPMIRSSVYPFSRVEHHLDAPAGGETTQQAHLLDIYWVKTSCHSDSSWVDCGGELPSEDCCPRSGVVQKVVGPWLVTLDGRHYRPGHPEVTVLRPGEFVFRVRDTLARLKGR